MHELGLTQSIVDIAVEHAKRNNASKILKVNVTIGDMMSVIEDSMQFYFEYLTKDTIAGGSKLEIDHVPISIRCANCKEESRVTEFEIYTCPRCGSLAVELLSGKEFYVDSIEIE